MKSFNLYSTEGCHLCEQAKAMALPLLQKYRCSLTEIEISDSDALMARFGVIIPVLECVESQQQLCWPFQPADIEQLLQS